MVLVITPLSSLERKCWPHIFCNIKFIYCFCCFCWLCLVFQLVALMNSKSGWYEKNYFVAKKNCLSLPKIKLININHKNLWSITLHTFYPSLYLSLSGFISSVLVPLPNYENVCFFGKRTPKNHKMPLAKTLWNVAELLCLLSTVNTTTTCLHT